MEFPQNRHYLRENKNSPFIEVVGEASVSAVPNRGQVTLGVVSEGENLAEIQQQNSTAVTEVIRSIRQLGIPSEKIQTIDYQITPQYSYENGKQIWKGYRVQHLLKIEIEPIEKTGPVIDAAVQAGANTISAIMFTVSQPDVFYNRALKAAVQNGTQKARSIAGAFGSAPASKPFQIIELSQMPFPVQEKAVFSTQAVQTPIEPGQLVFTASVRMKFHF
ncbi:SIMPL domain-containing protein [Bacillaceae bacterium Marseille-Q3522]|nr:SIMPL domain-containing protein [Bacillaceae bacterium Marseille-Q3522]